MARDPICGMDVAEEGARFMVHYEHETFYFCSNQCKETFVHQSGWNPADVNKGVLRRFLERIAQGTANGFGGKPPKCH